MVFHMAEFQVHQQERLVVGGSLETEVHMVLVVASFEVSVLDMLDEVRKEVNVLQCL